jgi:hypothetical protein
MWARRELRTQGRSRRNRSDHAVLLFQYRFLDWVRRLGLDIPIVPGIMPLTDFAQVERFSKFCGANSPAWIRKRMHALEGDVRGQEELGIELATRQAEELLRSGAPGLHFYTLNRAEPTLRIWHSLGFSETTVHALVQLPRIDRKARDSRRPWRDSVAFWQLSAAMGSRTSDPLLAAVAGRARPSRVSRRRGGREAARSEFGTGPVAASVQRFARHGLKR